MGIENAQSNELHKAKNDSVSIALPITPNFWSIRIYVFYYFLLYTRRAVLTQTIEKELVFAPQENS